MPHLDSPSLRSRDRRAQRIAARCEKILAIAPSAGGLVKAMKLVARRYRVPFGTVRAHFYQWQRGGRNAAAVRDLRPRGFRWRPQPSQVRALLAELRGPRCVSLEGAVREVFGEPPVCLNTLRRFVAARISPGERIELRKVWRARRYLVRAERDHARTLAKGKEAGL